MPMLEVLYAGQKALSAEQKRAFADAAEAIFQQVLGTPRGRLRLFFFDLSAEGMKEGASGDGPVSHRERAPGLSDG
jgi:phenylpyruvate tautomerase PptA (4-oxalocrotonate tautomerase family)